jgi:chromosome segregation ATPase
VSINANAALQAQLAAVQTDLDTAQETRVESTEAVTHLEVQVVETGERLHETRTELDRQERKYADLELKLKEERLEAKERFGEMEKHRDSASLQLEEYRADLKQQKVMIKALTERQDDLEHELSDKQARVKTLEQAVENLEATIVTLERERARLEAEAKRWQGMEGDTRARLEEQNAELNQKLTDEKAARQTAHAAAEAGVDHARLAKAQALRDAEEHKAAAVNALQDQLEAQQETLAEQKAAALLAAQEREVAVSELGTEQAKLAAAQAHAADQASSLAALTDEFETVRRALGQHQADAANARESLTHAEAQHAAAAEAHRATEARAATLLEERRVEKEELGSKTAPLEAAVASMTEALAAREETLASASLELQLQTRQAKTSQEQAEQKAQQLAALDTQLQNARVENMRLKEEVLHWSEKESQTAKRLGERLAEMQMEMRSQMDATALDKQKHEREVKRLKMTHSDALTEEEAKRLEGVALMQSQIRSLEDDVAAANERAAAARREAGDALTTRESAEAHLARKQRELSELQDRSDEQATSLLRLQAQLAVATEARMHAEAERASAGVELDAARESGSRAMREADLSAVKRAGVELALNELREAAEIRTDNLRRQLGVEHEIVEAARAQQQEATSRAQRAEASVAQTNRNSEQLGDELAAAKEAARQAAGAAAAREAALQDTLRRGAEERAALETSLVGEQGERAGEHAAAERSAAVGRVERAAQQEAFAAERAQAEADRQVGERALRRELQTALDQLEAAALQRKRDGEEVERATRAVQAVEAEQAGNLQSIEALKTERQEAQQAAADERHAAEGLKRELGQKTAQGEQLSEELGRALAELGDVQADGDAHRSGTQAEQRNMNSTIVTLRQVRGVLHRVASCCIVLHRAVSCCIVLYRVVRSLLFLFRVHAAC